MNALPRISYSGPLWHVAYTEPRAERHVTEAVRDELGFAVYGPAERLVEVRRGRKVDVERPYFPRYLFVEVDPYRQEWQALLGIEGVIDVLGKPGAGEERLPSHVPLAWIEALRKAEELGIFDRTRRVPNRFKIGEHVRLSDGPFAGFNATIEEFIAKLRSAKAVKRAKVLVDFMGRMSSMEVDITALEKL